jgi:hypothetical protein
MVGCATATVEPVTQEVYVDRHILMSKDYERTCNDLQTDFLFMFDSGRYESSFVDYGTRAIYRIGKWQLTDIPSYGPSVPMPPNRKIDDIRWYTSVEFLSFGDRCSVSVRETNPIKDKKLNGEEIIKLLQQLER